MYVTYTCLSLITSKYGISLSNIPGSFTKDISFEMFTQPFVNIHVIYGKIYVLDSSVFGHRSVICGFK